MPAQRLGSRTRPAQQAMALGRGSVEEIEEAINELLEKYFWEIVSCSLVTGKDGDFDFIALVVFKETKE